MGFLFVGRRDGVDGGGGDGGGFVGPEEDRICTSAQLKNSVFV